MSLADSRLPEFDQEMAATRRLLERGPERDIPRLALWGRHVLAQAELDLGLPENASHGPTADIR